MMFVNFLMASDRIEVKITPSSYLHLASIKTMEVYTVLVYSLQDIISLT